MEYICLICGSAWHKEDLLKLSDGRLACGEVRCGAPVVEAAQLSPTALWEIHDKHCDYDVDIEGGERNCYCDISFVILNRIIDSTMFEAAQPA